MATPKVGEIWQHYKDKTKRYKIIVLSDFEQTSEPMVTYQNVEGGPFWTRYISDFTAYISRDGTTRFSLVKNEDLVSEATKRGFNS